MTQSGNSIFFMIYVGMFASRVRVYW